MELKLEHLDHQHGVYVSKDHRFGTDAFLLASFSAAKHKDRVCDIGTGCGIIPMILHKKYEPKHIIGLDIQEIAIAQFQKSIEYYHLQNEMRAIVADIRTLPDFVKNTTFDLITCNPPYKISGKGILSTSQSDQIARHETMCTIQDICSSAQTLLQFGGRLCLCQRPERLADTITAMRTAKIEPKRLRFVAKDATSPPWLFLLEGKKGSKPFMKVEPLLIIQGEQGFSDELLEIYGKK